LVGQVGVIPEESALLTSVEFSHVLIFFMAMFLIFQVINNPRVHVSANHSNRNMCSILQAINVGLAGTRTKKLWAAFANESKDEIFFKFPDLAAIESVVEWEDERFAMLRWIILKAVFLRFRQGELIAKQEDFRHGELKT
jgi:hypothetical protein